MKTFNFSSEFFDFGNYVGVSQIEAQENFAIDAGYKTWQEMIDQGNEICGTPKNDWMKVYEVSSIN